MKNEPVYFDRVDDGDPDGKAPSVRPWKKVPLDDSHSGAWVVVGDINSDGKIEIVSARNVNEGDVHYTSAVVAQDLTGRVLWRWGDPHIGRRGLHHDVACQIHDWDGDGNNEVILCAGGYLVELDGATGEERRRVPLPPEATDCLVFADLSGRGRASDVLVKTRYEQIWALNQAGKLLWTVKNPGGFPTAHQPFPVDVDGNGRDEIMAGYALLNPDGQVRWVVPDEGRFTGPGHLDCCRVLSRGKTPRDLRLVLSCCGHKKLIAVDGTGAVQWEVSGHHFESIDIGHIHPDRPGPQILVDLVPPVAGPRNYALWILDEHGELLGQLTTEYGRFHTLVDWDGDGNDEIVLPQSRSLFDFRGERIGSFAMEPQSDPYDGQPTAAGEIGNIVLHGNMAGKGGNDVAITTPHTVCIFRNKNSRASGKSPMLGCGANFTLY